MSFNLVSYYREHSGQRSAGTFHAPSEKVSYFQLNIKGIKRKGRLLTQVLPLVIILFPVVTRWQINCV